GVEEDVDPGVPVVGLLLGVPLDRAGDPVLVQDGEVPQVRVLEVGGDLGGEVVAAPPVLAHLRGGADLGEHGDVALLGGTQRDDTSGEHGHGAERTARVPPWPWAPAPPRLAPGPGLGRKDRATCATCAAGAGGRPGAPPRVKRPRPRSSPGTRSHAMVSAPYGMGYPIVRRGCGRRAGDRGGALSALSVLDREPSVAPWDYSTWLIAPAAPAVHLSIGQAYATSVYKNSLVAHFDTGQTQIGIVFSIAIVMLGLSAAVGGTWVERAGPRKAMLVSALCWSSGFLVSAAGIAAGQLWLVYLGYGEIGGIGLGIGYISPVSTLIKWFPDRPGLATGMAIMGFGGGALIATPVSDALLAFYDPAYDSGAAG